MTWLRGFTCIIFDSKILENSQKTYKNATHATRNATRNYAFKFLNSEK